MNETNIYENIKNPLNEDNIIELVLANFNRDDKVSNYSLLCNINTKEVLDLNKPQKEFEKERNIFFTNLFNAWKNKLLRITNNKELIKLLNSLDYKDYYNITYFFNNVIYDYQGKFPQLCITPFLYNGFYNIYSKNISNIKANKDFEDIKHRLYINLSNKNIYKFLDEFTKRCINNNLPFYYKFQDNSRRADSFVIYSNTENLYKYKQIIDSIVRDYPQIKETSGKPPILSGTIDGWIGYGSEPKEDGESFNSKRSDLIFFSYKNACLNRLLKNHDIIKINNFNYSPIQYVVSQTTKEILKENNIELNEDNYSKTYIQIYNYLRSNDFKKNYNANVIINNKKLYYNNYMFLNSYKKYTNLLDKYKLNQEIKELCIEFKNKITEYSKIIGIDQDNFSFDIDKKEELLEYQKKQKELTVKFRTIFDIIKSKRNNKEQNTNNNMKGYR